MGLGEEERDVVVEPSCRKANPGEGHDEVQAVVGIEETVEAKEATWAGEDCRGGGESGARIVL